MTNTNQTNWYQNLIENIQEQEWYQNIVSTLPMFGLGSILGGLIGFSVLMDHYSPVPHYPQNKLITLTHALQIEQQNNPSNAQAIANQFGGMSNLEQAVSNYDNMTHINVNHSSLPNFNNGNAHLDSLVSSSNEVEAIVNLNYHTHEMQPVHGTKGLISEPVTVHHTITIGQSSINPALQQAPSNKLKGGE